MKQRPSIQIDQKQRKLQSNQVQEKNNNIKKPEPCKDILMLEPDELQIADDPDIEI